jgi:glucose-1-phosphate thymidylyltransferase
MQAIILAAGTGTRMRPLTNFVPKPMVRFIGADGVRRNLIEHNLEILPKEVDEIILIVGYLKEQMMNHFGDKFNGRKVRYIVQDEQFGTAHAVNLVKEYITGKFIVMMSDDIYSRADMEVIVNTPKSAVLVKKINNKFSGGNVILDEDGHLIDIKEGSHEGGYINAALYAIMPEYFDYPLVSIAGGTEYGLPQTLVLMAKEHQVKVINSKWWKQISNLEDVKNAPDVIKDRI